MTQQRDCPGTLRRPQRRASACVEYAAVLMLVSLPLVVTLRQVGGELGLVFSSVFSVWVDPDPD